MKRTIKKLSLDATTIRSLRPLTADDAARVAGATLNGSCQRVTIGGCPAGTAANTFGPICV